MQIALGGLQFLQLYPLLPEDDAVFSELVKLDLGGRGGACRYSGNFAGCGGSPLNQVLGVYRLFLMARG